MPNVTRTRIKCDKCNVKVPKAQPKLRCTVCNNLKHLACQKLTKSDANYIIQLKIQWTCSECMQQILPVNACWSLEKSKKSKETAPKFKIKCAACNGFSYSARNVRTCDYCIKQVHLKCWNNSLGCRTCCENMIPGFYSYANELIGDPNSKNDKVFNPYNRNHFTQLIGDMFDGEEESSHVFEDVSELLVNCTYKQPKNIPTPSDLELSIFSLNIRTLASKIETMRENIAFYENFDVLLFNETNCILKKLPNGKTDIELDGFYEPFVQDPIRKSGKGGGLAIYVNKRVCVDKDDIELFSPCSESENTSGEFQFIKIKNCKGHRKTVILGNVYRSPSAKPDLFNISFENILRKLNNNRYANKLKYIVGDFNQDLIKYDSNIDCQNLVDNAHNNGFVQLISRPTRVTDHSATLIDLVFADNIKSTLSSNILTVDLSDHLATHTKLSLGTSNQQIRRSNKKQEKREYRIFTEANNQIFAQLIKEEKWEEISDNMGAQDSYDKLTEIYMKHYNTAYPLNSNRIRRNHERKDPKPWILPWLEDACARKNKLFHNFVKNPSPENKTKYVKLDNFCKKHINTAKIKYRKAYFEKYKDDSKKQWQMINELLGRKRKSVSINKLTDCNGDISSTPASIANNFNTYFSNIASDLKSKRIDSQGRNGDEDYHQTYLKNSVSNTLFLSMVDASEVYEVIKNFKNKSTQDTKISALKIANTSYNFTNILACTINKSFHEGLFPEQMKTARVTPIFKEGSKTNVENYRPISILNSFSKIYEKLMHIRLSNFLESNNSIYENQYGFRSGRSCEHALLNAQNLLLDSLSKHQVSIILLIDFSKAFDLVEHKILLNKLEHYGIRGPALKWLESYLSNRKQYVSVNGAESTSLILEHGVPQGSILGPLLFIIYINDMPEISTSAKFILYADDANIIITSDTVEQASEQIEMLSKKLVHWVSSNGLVLNLKKTKYMIFSQTRNLELSQPLIISDTLIERKNEARFLGVIMDDKLNWSRHIKTVQSKMARYVGILYKIKKYLPLHARIQIYHSFVQSHINYCSLVWGFSSKDNIESIFAKQKKGLRAVIPGFINYRYRAGDIPGHTKSYFTEYNILTVHSTIVLNALIFMEKVHNYPSLLPLSILRTISHDSPVPGSNHETCENWLNVYNNFLYRSSIFFKGPLLFADSELNDNLPPVSSLNIKTYRAKLKLELLNLQSSGEPCEWQNSNFPLYNITGLRKSVATYRSTINYADI